MAGVYVSYPFCQQKCSFCNFASGVAPAEIREQYHAALIREIESCNWPWLPETLYLGGGTPSLMPTELIARVVDSIPRDCLSEVTIECAPGTITSGSAAFWRSCGLNRVSLGVQSFVPAELRQTGRRHTAETVRGDMAILHREGIVDINLDLIAGLPEQTRATWEESLNWIEHLRPSHVSVYIFEEDSESRLGKELISGGARYGAAQMPSEAATVEFYERAVLRLRQMGLERYEVSNFAKPGFASRHNLKYWRLEPYLGFGLDAHSYDGRFRWSNSDDLKHYLSAADERTQPVTTDYEEEHFFVGLRLTEGIEPTEAEWDRFAEPIEKWMKEGMLEREGKRLRLAPAAVVVSNEILQEFVECPVTAG